MTGDDDKAEEPDFAHGPCMMALSEKRRAFVMAMARNPLGTAKDWANEAGYAKAGLKVRAFEAYHDPKVQSAILEVAKSLMGAEGPLLAVQGLLAIARNPKHRDHTRVLEMLANRTGFSEKQQIEITHTHRDLTGDALLERIRFLGAKHGIDVTRLDGLTPPEPKAIEHQAAPNGKDEGDAP